MSLKERQSLVFGGLELDGGSGFALLQRQKTFQIAPDLFGVLSRKGTDTEVIGSKLLGSSGLKDGLGDAFVFVSTANFNVVACTLVAEILYLQRAYIQISDRSGLCFLGAFLTEPFRFSSKSCP